MNEDEDDLIAAAQALARNCSWAVFPCNDAKKPAIPKKDGGNGFLDASTDPDVIQGLFQRAHCPTLIGIATGAVSGFDVLDVDVKHGTARAWLISAQSRIPLTRTYQTRGGGFHICFQHAAGVRNTESDIAKGLDTRGDGGYVISWFAAGFPCTDHSPIAEWPAWLLQALFYKPPPPPNQPQQQFNGSGGDADKLIAATLARLENAPEGSRHATLRAAACTMGGVLDAAGIARPAASRMLLDAVLRAGGAAVNQQNALATIAWGLERGAASPLQVGGAR